MALASDIDLDGIIEQVYALVNVDSDPPASSDDEYIIITRLANAAINRWENNKGELWSDLWSNLTDAADGEKTIVDGTSEYDAPSDFRYPGGWVRLVSGNQERKVPVIKPHEAQKQPVSSSARYAYFTGKKGAVKLNFTVAPDSEIDGWTIKYDYYKFATKLENASDTPEMLDPYMIIYFACSELIREEDPQRWQTYRTDAEEKLKEMEIMNTQYPPYQNYQPEDAQAIATGEVLGE